MILRARGIEHLVFFGITTSGIMLSTLRGAFELDLEGQCNTDQKSLQKYLNNQ